MLIYEETSQEITLEAISCRPDKCCNRTRARVPHRVNELLRP